MKYIPRIGTLLAGLLFFFGGKAAAQKAGNVYARIDSFINTTTPRPFNGAVVVTQRGKVRYAKAHGYADFRTKKPLSVNDRFSSMSIAKQVTATLVLQQVAKGTIDLNASVGQYLPDLKKYAWAGTVTIRQLLNHSSGLPSDALGDTLRFAPGTQFGYSNAGYNLLGRVLEKQSGKSYQELVGAIFRKCGMDRSGYPPSGLQSDLLKGHPVNRDNTVTENGKATFPVSYYFSSHLVVTAEDLDSWNECLHNGKLLPPDLYRQMTTYSVTNRHPLFGSEAIGYGFGLRINDKAVPKEIGHTGYSPVAGYTAVNLYYPETRTSVIVLENQAYENFDIAYYFEAGIRNIILESGLLKPPNR